MFTDDFYRIIEEKSSYFVLDVGGDDRGALALGRFVPGILEENDYENFLVVNFLRPLSRTAEDVLQVIQEITQAAGMRFTAVINNTNLGAETTVDIIQKGYKEALRLQEASGLPIAINSVEQGFATKVDLPDVLPLALQKRPID